jgi:hypothetical protein
MYQVKPLETYKKYSEKMRIYPAQMDTQSFGNLQVRATSDRFAPIENALVTISSSDDPSNIIEQFATNESGLSPLISLPTPPIEYSLEPASPRPYATYNIIISAPGYETELIENSEVLPDSIALQNSILLPSLEEVELIFNISPHTLYYEYPPKIPEAEIKPVGETGEIVLSRVVVPEFIIVHDGSPNENAPNYWVPFRDYIKNVASSEIYATWPESTIYANVLAILSFTLNRVYTEWYRSQGYNFTITSSTAYDHKWIRNRNIYENISFIVDSVFVNYLSRPNVRQPILTQYCDGYRVTCPNWMSQWGSKDLGEQGYSAIEILRNYYGNSIYINTATEVSGVPSSWPGTNLTIGSRGENVRIIQSQLNRIAENFPAIPLIAVDGIYGPRTAEAVTRFRSIFDLPANGIVDMPTWYKISFIYVAVTRMAEF